MKVDNKSKKPSGPLPAGRPKKVTREQIVSAALDVMEKDGFAALTMRSLGRELGIKHSTLYNYIDDLGDVEQAALDELMTRIPMPDPSKPEPLKQQFIEHLLAVRQIQILFPKFCHAPPGTRTWRLLMGCMAGILSSCCQNDDQLEDFAIAHNALLGLIATSAEHSRITGHNTPIKSDLEAIAELPRDQYAPLFRPLEKNGQYSMKLSSFVHRLDHLITCLIPHLGALNAAELDRISKDFNRQNDSAPHDPALRN